MRIYGHFLRPVIPLNAVPFCPVLGRLGPSLGPAPASKSAGAASKNRRARPVIVTQIPQCFEKPARERERRSRLRPAARFLPHPHPTPGLFEEWVAGFRGRSLF